MLRPNVLSAAYKASELNLAERKGKFRSILSFNNIQVSGTVKVPPRSGESNPSFVLYVDESTRECVERIHERVETLLKNIGDDLPVKSPLYTAPTDEDEPSAKKKRTMVSLKVKTLDASTRIQNQDLEDAELTSLQEDSTLIASLKPAYLYAMADHYVLTFTTPKLVVLEASTKLLGENEASNQHICKVTEDAWLRALTAKDPNYGANQMIYVDYTRGKKVQLEGGCYYGIDFSHEYNQGARILYSLSTSDEAISMLRELDAKADAVVASFPELEKLQLVENKTVVNVRNPDYPKVNLKLVRSKVNVFHFTKDEGRFDRGKLQDLSAKNQEVVVLARPTGINISKKTRSYATQLVITDIFLKPSQTACEDFDSKFISALKDM